MLSTRDHFIDFARAIAIALMFFAHLLPHFSTTGLDEIFIFRLLSSIPAPLFLLLTGFNYSEKQFFKEVFYKALVFLGVGAFMDVVIWGIIPFYSFDVFYVIGLGYLLLYFYSKWSLFWQLGTISFVLLLANILQFKYQKQIPEVTFSELSNYKIEYVVQNLFFNGWFPLFPWLAFIFFGFTCKKHQLLEQNRSFLSLLLGVLVLAVSIYLLHTSALFEPDFAVEIFYPANGLYLFFAFGFIHTFWFLKPLLKSNKWITSIQLFGRYSLVLYVLHLSALHLFSQPIEMLIQLSINPFLQLAIALAALIILMLCLWKLILWFKTTKYYLSRSNYLLLRMLFH